MFQRNEDIRKEYDQVQKGDYSREDGIIGYAWVSHYTAEFLDAYLKHDSTALAFIKKTPAENGAPSHLPNVDFRAAKGIPASLESFRAELRRQGFDHAPAIYPALLKDQPDFKLEETPMGLRPDGEESPA